MTFFSSWLRSIIASNSSHRPRTVAGGSRYIRPMKVRYSRAVRLSNSASSSGTTPIRRLTLRAASASAKSASRIRIVPLVGASRPVSILMVVDLPAPLGPRKPKNFPASTDKSSWSTAHRPETACQPLGLDGNRHERDSPCTVAPSPTALSYPVH